MHQVPATLLEAAPTWSAYGNGVGVPGVEARRRTPDGRVRTGEVFVPAGAAVGSTMLVWTNRAGQLTGPPLGPVQLTSRAQMTAAAAAGSLAITLITVGWLTRGSLDRRRLAAWDADWLANGPQWSPRR